MTVLMGDDFYFPVYDNNGNIVQYLEESGGVVASYLYDDFGDVTFVLENSSCTFSHRFSTKHFDVYSDLYYFGYRFYNPVLKCWVHADPIGEAGGINLYGFIENNSPCNIDYLGETANWHHLLPVQFESYFRQAGLDIDAKEFGYILEDVDHYRKGGIHPGWNSAWRNFFMLNPKATKEEILQRLREMENQPDFKNKLSRGCRAKVSYDKWKPAMVVARDNVLSFVSKGKVQKNCHGAKRIIKRVPLLGVMFIVNDVRAKGVKNGVANSLLDACPFIGWVKFFDECLDGDWFPNVE